MEPLNVGFESAWLSMLASPGFMALMVWGLYWKGLGLWHAAQRGAVWWFVAILFINIAGILEIIYLFAVLKLRFKDLFTSRVSDAHREGLL